MMLDIVNQPETVNSWFGEFITQFRYELDVAPPEPPYQPDEIYDALKQGDFAGAPCRPVCAARGR